MTSPHLPLHFDSTSIALFFREEAFRSFLSGATVVLEDIDDEGDLAPVCLDPECLADGPCLVALDSEIDFKVSPDPKRFRDDMPAVDPHAYVLSTTDNLWLAEHHGGHVCRTSDHSLKHLLQAGCVSIDDTVGTIPMRFLERWMCCDGGAISDWDRTMYQYPGSYRALYETGSFAGIINRSFCHLGCGADFVWVVDGLCVLWMRHLGGPYVKWIRLFPFRVDRSEKPGRLSSRFRTRYFWASLLALFGYRRQAIKGRIRDV